MFRNPIPPSVSIKYAAPHAAEVLWMQYGACFLILLMAVSACLAGEAVPSTEPTGLYPVQVGGKWGYIDRTGKTRIRPQYEQAQPFVEQRAWVFLGGKAVLIDTDGTVIQQSEYNEASPFTDGLALVGVGVRWDGAPLRQPDGNFNLGARVPMLDGHWGFMDRDGKLAIEARFDWASPFHEDAAVVVMAGPDAKHQDPLADWTDARYGLVDKAGRYLIEPRTSIRLSGVSEGLLAASVGQGIASDWKWGFVDKSGKWRVERGRS